MRRLFLTVPLSCALVVASGAHTSFAQAPAPPPAPQATPQAGPAGGAPQAPTATDPKAAELVGRVQAFYDKTNSFKSDFRQEFWVKAYNQKKTSRGNVTFAKPGRMDWVYDEPKGNRVVSDGVMLRVYEAANKQMYEQQVDRSQYPAALAFLTGQGKLSDAFSFELYDGEKMNFPGGKVLVGSPRQPTPAYQKVLFYVDANTAQVRRVLILDGQGNRNRFDFVNPRVNEAVTATQFKFTPPPGTSIVRP